MRRPEEKRFRLFRGHRGMSLIETLVALAILGLIAIVFVSGMGTAFKGVAVSQEQVATESLAKSQAEYTISQDYVAVADYDPNDPANRYELIDISGDLIAAGYSVTMSTPQEVISSAEGGFELQSVTIKVQRNGQDKLNITFYRLDK